MYSAKKQNLFVIIFDTSFQSMVLGYANVNIHITALLEHTFYYITVEGFVHLRATGSRQQLAGFVSSHFFHTLFR